MKEIKINIIEKELYYQGEVIVRYKIEYPEIINSHYKEGMRIFNQENRKIALERKEYAEEELYEQAKQTYEFNKKNSYPIMIYELIRECNITYNREQLLSLYCDEYIFEGGAHGNTLRKSQNWNLELVKEIPLQAFSKGNPYYLVNILKQINNQITKQIEDGTGAYFPEYCQLVLETFNIENYYLTQKGIVIFFQQYDIAPYASGIHTFLVK